MTFITPVHAKTVHKECATTLLTFLYGTKITAAEAGSGDVLMMNKGGSMSKSLNAPNIKGESLRSCIHISVSTILTEKFKKQILISREVSVQLCWVYKENC